LGARQGLTYAQLLCRQKPFFHLIRLFFFLMILFAIIDKNRAGGETGRISK
jgi:hypothetical protein